MVEFLSLICVAAMSALLFGLIGCDQGAANTQQDAVRAGVAEYYINTNTFQREFRWLTNRVEVKP